MSFLYAFLGVQTNKTGYGIVSKVREGSRFSACLLSHKIVHEERALENHRENTILEWWKNKDGENFQSRI